MLVQPIKRKRKRVRTILHHRQMVWVLSNAVSITNWANGIHRTAEALHLMLFENLDPLNFSSCLSNKFFFLICFDKKLFLISLLFERVFRASQGRFKSFSSHLAGFNVYGALPIYKMFFLIYVRLLLLKKVCQKSFSSKQNASWSSCITDTANTMRFLAGKVLPVAALLVC